MDIHFEGFQNTISLIWMFIILIGVIGISYWTYHHVEGLSPLYRGVLTTLRSAAFILLILLLLNPVLTVEEQESRPLRIALLLDNSQSTDIEKGSYGGSDHYEEIIGQLLPGNDDRYEHVEIEPYGFDAELFELSSPFELNFDGARTNIDQALADFLEVMENQEAAILVSDGIITAGRDPSATASRTPVPVYTIGIGDTTRQKDILVQRISHNPSAPVNSIINVEASILNEGFPDRDIPVQLRQNEQVLEETVIRSSEERSVQQVRFDLSLEEEGLQPFNIHIPELGEEWSTENNTRYFSVDVRDEQLRILHLAYEVHPDVRNFRNLLQEDKQILLDSRTWVHNDRYIEGNLPDEADTLDLVILHGFPHIDLPADEAQMVADRFRDNAMLIVGTAGQNQERLAALMHGTLPLHFESDLNWYDVRIDLTSEQADHAILDFSMPEDTRFEEIRGAIRNVTVAPNTDVLLQSVYQGSVTNTPLLAVRSTGNRHIAHLNGYGFYRWSLSNQERTREFWINLLNNTVKWTAARPDDDLLELRPSEPIFQVGEPVLMDAFLRNESGEPEENGVVEILVEGKDPESRRYIMGNEGEGHYRIEISNLAEGTYDYTGVATRSDRELDSQSGQFTVGGVNREFVNTIRDEHTLQQIADLTSGSYLPFESAHELMGILEEQLGFEQRVDTISQSLSLYRHPLWFIVLILLLATEWSLRKYRALA